MADLSKATHQQLIATLKAIANAAMNSSSAPPELDSYEKRSRTAQQIGEELHRRGGITMMKAALEKDLGWMPGCRTIEGFWDGIGDWRG